MPFSRPVTIIGLAAFVAVMPLGLEVTMYEVIGLPPFPGIPRTAGGITKLTVACAFPLTAVPMVGAFGIVVGVTYGLHTDVELVPLEFVANIRKV